MNKIDEMVTAFVGLRALIVTPDIKVLARDPNGTVALRLNGRDGSWLDVTMLVPPCAAAAPSLEIVDIRAWYAPGKTPFGRDGAGDLGMKQRMLLLLLVESCRKAVVEALGSGARHAAWWTDTPPIRPLPG